MSSLARAIGKGLRGAAAVAVPMAFEEQKRQIQSERDAMLQSYAEKAQASQQAFQTGERKSGEAFTSGQNELTRNQQAAQNSQQVALKAGELAIQQQNADRQGEVADAQIEQLHAGIKEITQKIAAGDLAAKDVKELRDLREKTILALEDPTTKPEEIKRLTTQLAVKTGTYKDKSKPTFEKLKTKDEQGNETEMPIFADPENQTITYPKGAPGGKPSASSGSIEQINADFIKGAGNHDAADFAAYDKIVGKPGAGQALLDAHFSNPNSQTQLSANSGQQPKAGSLSAQTAPTADESVLSGFNLDAPQSQSIIGKTADAIKETVSGKISAAKAGRVKEVVSQAKKIIAGNNLFQLGTIKPNLQDALNSGLLSDKESSIIRAWLSKQK